MAFVSIGKFIKKMDYLIKLHLEKGLPPFSEKHRFLFG